MMRSMVMFGSYTFMRRLPGLRPYARPGAVLRLPAARAGDRPQPYARCAFGWLQGGDRVVAGRRPGAPRPAARGASWFACPRCRRSWRTRLSTPSRRAFASQAPWRPNERNTRKPRRSGGRGAHADSRRSTILAAAHRSAWRTSSTVRVHGSDAGIEARSTACIEG